MGPHMFSLERVQSAFQFLLGGCLRSGLNASVANRRATIFHAPMRLPESSLGGSRWTADEDDNHTPKRVWSELECVPAAGYLLLWGTCGPTGLASPELRKARPPGVGSDYSWPTPPMPSPCHQRSPWDLQATGNPASWPFLRPETTACQSKHWACDDKREGRPQRE